MRWQFRSPIPGEWLLHFDRLILKARFSTSSKHVGVFPEQSAHWRWIKAQLASDPRRPIQVLNLFGYTGVATLAAASTGAHVTHVDASKVAITWAKDNQHLSGLDQAPIRWIVDDSIKFVKREANRQKRYDAIILDPPAFGRGPKGEVWKADRDLVKLLTLCRQVLSDNPLFIILTMYSLDVSSVLLGNVLRNMMRGLAGRIEMGELILKPKYSDQTLPMSIYSLWERTISQSL